uniref:Uncharacterized protein n=1 Tax=Rhizophora mucronata TaxID=61149 RepID=A0A2P2MYB3_RHIMU
MMHFQQKHIFSFYHHDLSILILEYFNFDVSLIAFGPHLLLLFPMSEQATMPCSKTHV